MKSVRLSTKKELLEYCRKTYNGCDQEWEKRVERVPSWKMVRDIERYNAHMEELRDGKA